MKAAWYERQGRARDVLVVGEMPDSEPGPGELRIRVVASGINPGDVKKREDTFGLDMPYPRVIPHGDGAGTVDAIGPDVSRSCSRTWGCFSWEAMILLHPPNALRLRPSTRRSKPVGRVSNGYSDFLYRR